MANPRMRKLRKAARLAKLNKVEETTEEEVVEETAVTLEVEPEVEGEEIAAPPLEVVEEKPKKKYSGVVLDVKKPTKAKKATKKTTKPKKTTKKK